MLRIASGPAAATWCKQPNLLNRTLTFNLLQEGPLILGRLAGAMSADDLKQCLEYIRQVWKAVLEATKFWIGIGRASMSADDLTHCLG